MRTWICLALFADLNSNLASSVSLDVSEHLIPSHACRIPEDDPARTGEMIEKTTAVRSVPGATGGTNGETRDGTKVMDIARGQAPVGSFRNGAAVVSD